MKRILWATATVGLSSIVVVALGAVRYKLIAVGVGASGVGLVGILTAAANFGVILFSLGINTSGVQAIAAAVDDPQRLERVKSALLAGSRSLGLLGGLVVVVVGALGGVWLLPGASDAVTVLALGAALCAMVISGAQLGLLNGIGRVRSLAICNTVGAMVGTGLTAAAIQVSQQAAVIAALLGAPVATLACSTWFVMRERKARPRPSMRHWWPELRGLVALGGVVMLGLLLTSGTQLAIRVWIERTEGLAAAGHFQAAWTITSMYIGFALTALAVEYYPRISALADDPQTLNRNVDAQVRLASVLAGPVLLWMMVLAPIVLSVLYATEFDAATGLLRWQLWGDVLKVVSWAVAFLLLARRARGAFFLGELCFNVAYIGLAVPLASVGGLTGLGGAYMGAYALYALTILVLAHRETRFSLRPVTSGVAGAFLVLAGITMWTTETGTVAGLASGIVIASLATVGSIAILHRMRALERRTEDEAGAGP